MKAFHRNLPYNHPILNTGINFLINRRMLPCPDKYRPLHFQFLNQLPVLLITARVFRPKQQLIIWQNIKIRIRMIPYNFKIPLNRLFINIDHQNTQIRIIFLALNHLNHRQNIPVFSPISNHSASVCLKNPFAVALYHLLIPVGLPNWKICPD